MLALQGRLMRGRTILALAGVVVLGCNSSTTGLPAGISASCSVTLSGALSGTYDCRPATTEWSAYNDGGGFTFAVPTSGIRPAVGVAIVWLGEPTTRTYANTDADAQADVRVTAASGQSWLATVNEGTAPAGNYSLTFSSVTANQAGASGKVYDGEGTLTAKLPAVTSTGATDTITVTATF